MEQWISNLTNMENELFLLCYAFNSCQTCWQALWIFLYNACYFHNNKKHKNLLLFFFGLNKYYLMEKWLEFLSNDKKEHMMGMHLKKSINICDINKIKVHEITLFITIVIQSFQFYTHSLSLKVRVRP